MHTPEPRRPRSSGGGADSVTPQADSTSVTPTPRAGFLRRGEAAQLHGAIAAGPSVLFDEETGTAVPLDVSPQPSQLTQTQQHQQQLHAYASAASQPLNFGSARLPRQRPRFHTVQDLDVALNQAIEGKITSRNAWASKEASDLLEGITHTIETTLDAGTADDYSGFAKAATVVEGCSKVWTSRVDSTYQQSNQMVQRLLRKDEAPGKGPGEEGEGEDGEEGEASELSQRNKTRSRSAAAAAAAAAARTLALDASEINLDSKSRTALTQTGVNAQFRAITSKFDQGNAQGLLMNNAPIGRAGNIILDVDYSLMPPAAMAAGRISGQRGSGRRGSTNVTVSAPADQGAEGAREAAVEPSRASQHLSVEHDAAVCEQVTNFPPFAGVAALGQPASGRASLAFPQRATAGDPSEVAGELARGSQASQVDPLLVPVPHPNGSLLSSPVAALDEARRFSSLKSEAGGEEAAAGKVSHVEGQRTGSADSDRDGDDGGYGVEDFGDWADGNDDGDEGDEGGDYQRGQPPLHRASNGVAAAASAYGMGDASDERGRGGRDLGLEARLLVSGVTEMEAMDTLFHGHTQLALEAEDPTAWCPLSEVAANPLAGGMGRSELSRLHREHRFTQPQRTPAQPAPDAADPQSPAAKRSRKERTVVFQLPEGAAAASAGLTFSTTAGAGNDAVLKQATTAARNVTPLGKQLLLAKDAAHAVVAYTQSSLQRSKAEQAGLLLPEAPIPGKTIPSYMPYPVHTQDYFQPFSTPLTQWNLLRKSATGRLIDSSSAAAAASEDATQTSASGSTATTAAPLHHRLGEYGGEGEDSRREADMPVEFFPGGAEVMAVDGGEAGDDYADYADLYGPDDHDDGDEEAERRYVEGGFHSSTDAQLVAQVELAAAAAASSGSGSAASSTRTSGGAAGQSTAGADPLELMKVLTSPEATVPNQVDVVRLRQLMWEALQGHLTANQQDAAVDLAALRHETAVERPTRRRGGVGGSPLSAKTAVKAHAQEALERVRRKRARAAETDGQRGEAGRKSDGDSDSDGSDQEDEDEILGLRKPSAASKSGDPFLTLSDAAAAKTAAAEVVQTKFSDVVRTVLPHIGSVSSTSTLSPAFFFFSILFLANEHNVVLQNVDTLDDLNACGIARRVGE